MKPILLENKEDFHQRFVFLGDSISHQGGYICLLSAYLKRKLNKAHLEFLNFGLGSEGVTGRTEPRHPYPRPNVHGRMDGIVSHIQRGDIAFICYGMNDGIYHPPCDDGLLAYQEGIRKLIKKLSSAGAFVIALTPPIFDAKTKQLLGQLLLKKSESDFGYDKVYEDYNETLREYADFILSLEKEGIPTVNLFAPMEKELKARREENPDYISGDGIHPNMDGHAVMAKTILCEVFGMMPDTDFGERFLQSEEYHIACRQVHLLADALREEVGHDNPTKAPNPLPVAEAFAEVAKLDTELHKIHNKEFNS